MSEQEKKAKDLQIADFLGIRVLTPLDERSLEDVAGGLDQHDHDHGGDHEHVYVPRSGNNDQ